MNVVNFYCFIVCVFGIILFFLGCFNLFYLYDGYKIMIFMKCLKGMWYRFDICICDWIILGKVEKEGMRVLIMMIILKG